jgi:hypothetical protein
MVRKALMVVVIVAGSAAIVYGGLFRSFQVYENLEKYDKLQSAGIKIKIPGYELKNGQLPLQSQWFSEPELVAAMTFEGIGRYKDGRLTSNYPDLRMLKTRRPCPT